ncbi:ABC transporter ATP-binding protein [Niameybacter massiliensis]|uniref:ABC transporter ATP-binding protein n=1 Tax=Niameybacter massiliensis TaxID=1658108 RepID=UPI0006B6114B|nr:ABC transporter ATP-binding protein [Niameybacter massiliensis]
MLTTIQKTWAQIKWLARHAKPVLGYLIFNTSVTAIFSCIGVYSALLSKSLIDAATTGDLPGVFKWLGLMALIFVFRITISSITSITSTKCSTKLRNNIQKHFYEHITYSEWLEHSKYHSVNLLTRINSDVSVIIGLITSTVSSLLSLTITFVASFITLFFLDRTVAILSIVIAPVLMLCSIVFGKKVKNLYMEVQDHNIKYNSFIQESIQNIMIIKTFCKEKKNMQDLESLQDTTMKLNLRSSIIGLIAGLFMTVSSYLTYFVVFSVGAYKIAVGLMSFGTMTAMLQLFNNIQSPLSGFASIVPNIIKSLASVERLMEVEALTLEDRTPKALAHLPNLKPSICFDQVSFSYQPEVPILKQISCCIEPGEIIGLVGPSGGGKTTLIRLLLSLAHPHEGHITLNTSHQTEEINALHRHLISYVPQGNTLFSGTIKDNLCYGNLLATDEEIQQASKRACAWSFITALDKGLETSLGEKGLGISEGQAQRLAIARAFLRQKPILILDEATSALDPETEVKVLHAIKTLPHKPTCLIITHRPSALSICDRVLRLENQKLTTVDSIDKLMKIESA